MIPLIATETKVMSSPSTAEADPVLAEGAIVFADMIATLTDAQGALTEGVAVPLEQRPAEVEKSFEAEGDSDAFALTPDEPVDPEQMVFPLADASDVTKTRDWQPIKAAEPVVGPMPKEPPKPATDTDPEDVPADQKTVATEKKAAPFPTAAQSVVEGQFPRAAPSTGSADKKADVRSDAPKPTPPISQATAKVEAAAKDPALHLSEKTLPSASPDARQLNLAETAKIALPVKGDWSLTAAKITKSTTVKHGVAATAEPLAPLRLMPSEAVKNIAGLEVPGDILMLSAAGERATVFVPTAAAPATAANPELARHVAGQLASGVAAQPGRVTEIALNPEELGKVRLSMASVDTTIALTVLAERPETADLLRRHIDVLEQEFKALGFEDISFSFGGEKRADGGGGRDHNADPLAENDIEVTNTPVQMRATDTDSGLDLRL